MAALPGGDGFGPAVLAARLQRSSQAGVRWVTSTAMHYEAMCTLKLQSGLGKGEAECPDTAMAPSAPARAQPLTSLSRFHTRITGSSLYSTPVMLLRLQAAAGTWHCQL